MSETSFAADSPFWSEFEAAVSFATRLHAGQLRKGEPGKGWDVPYLAHLIGVAGLVLEAGGSRDQVIAALLHDSVEDQSAHYPGGADGLRAEIASRFGTGVLAIVNGCSDSDTVPKPPWQVRKQAYIDHLVAAPAAVQLVSCADKLHNARAIVSDLHRIGAQVFERFKGGQSGTHWYYRELSQIFVHSSQQPGMPPGLGFLATELARTVAQIEAWPTAQAE